MVIGRMIRPGTGARLRGEAVRAHHLGAAACLLVAVLACGCDAQDLPSGSASAVDPAAGVREAASGAGSNSEAASLDAGASAVITLPSHLFVERNVTVLTRRAGIVSSVRANRGDRVRQGEILCELENGDLRIALDLARIDADKARAAFERSLELISEGAVSKEDHESAEFDLRSAEHEVEMAAYELEKSFVRAPFDGVVSARNVEVGQVLAEEDVRPLFRVTALRPLLARLYVPQWAYVHLSRRTPVVVHPAASSGASVEGRVQWINDVLDAASGSAEVLVEVPGGSAEDLRPGMEVSVELHLTLPAGRLTVPREAVAFDLDRAGSGVVTVVSGRTRETRQVRVGFQGDDRVEILSGLDAGEKVLLREEGTAGRFKPPS